MFFEIDKFEVLKFFYMRCAKEGIFDVHNTWFPNEIYMFINWLT